MTNTWLFQGNPARFDIDAFLADAPTSFTWTAAQQARKMAVGDTVFLWRAVGPDRDPRAGIVAEAVIAEGPAERPDSSPSHLWTNPADALKPQVRVNLALIRVARAKEIIKRDWLKRDPVLRDLMILRMANATNFLVEGQQRARLEALWSRTGRDWDYAETVAGMWAYNETLGRPISEQPGTPVAQVALMLGRTVGGVYNKVMNFRAIDPSDPRTGLLASSTLDAVVWAKFFDPATGIRSRELDDEFNALWHSRQSIAAAPSLPLATESSEADARDLAAKYTLEELLARYAAGQRGYEVRSRSGGRASWTRTYQRSPLVIAIAKVRACGRCEVPDCTHPTFLDVDGVPYVEVHHIEPLAEGGPDTPDNVACICPAHHREAHLGVEAERIAAMLRGIRCQPTLVSLPLRWASNEVSCRAASQ